jgi:predicted HTH domain antitoxin
MGLTGSRRRDRVEFEVPDEGKEGLEMLAGEAGWSWETTVRRVLEIRLREPELEAALDAHEEGEISLERSAERAGVPVEEIAEEAAARWISRVRYDREAMEEDVRRLRGVVEEGEEERDREEGRE